MKRLTALVLLTLAFSVPVMAGDTPMPPCTENCSQSAVSPTLTLLLVQVVTSIAPR